jgi:hypothetical protein
MNRRSSETPICSIPNCDYGTDGILSVNIVLPCCNNSVCVSCFLIFNIKECAICKRIIDNRNVYGYCRNIVDAEDNAEYHKYKKRKLKAENLELKMFRKNDQLKIYEKNEEIKTLKQQISVMKGEDHGECETEIGKLIACQHLIQLSLVTRCEQESKRKADANRKADE